MSRELRAPCSLQVLDGSPNALFPDPELALSPGGRILPLCLACPPAATPGPTLKQGHHLIKFSKSLILALSMKQFCLGTPLGLFFPRFPFPSPPATSRSELQGQPGGLGGRVDGKAAVLPDSCWDDGQDITLETTEPLLDTQQLCLLPLKLTASLDVSLGRASSWSLGSNLENKELIRRLEKHGGGR